MNTTTTAVTTATTTHPIFNHPNLAPAAKPSKKARTRKSKADPKPYPFATKAQLKARLEGEPSFVLQALLILDGRQTEDEREDKETKYRNHKGWMSSHAVWGTKLASKVALGQELEPEEFDRAQAMVCRYTRQLANHFRNLEIKRNPELAAKTACYFKPQS
jgi:hypothetical protein